MAPANNPFGAPSSSTANSNPFAQAGASQSSPFGQQTLSGFGAPAQQSATAAATTTATATTVTKGMPSSSSAGNPFNKPDGPQGLSRKPLSQTNSTHNPFAGSGPKQQQQSSQPSSFGAPTQPAAFTNGNPPSAPRFGAASTFGAPPKGPSATATTAASETNASGRRSGPWVDQINKRLKNDAAPPGPAARRKKSEANHQIDGQAAGGVTQQSKTGQKRREKDEQGGSRRVKGETNGPKNRPIRQQPITERTTERTKQMSEFAFKYANRLYDQLQKEGIKPPPWPPEPGNPSKRGAVEAHKEAYKKYRGRVYAALRKVDLIDDPDKRRKLEDALPFKGICEDMCPEFERISRIAEFDVKAEEKEAQADGVTMWAEPSRMIKKFGRSAAGQDAPLPMDVRSVDALRRTTDYLLDDLLQCDANLPSMHNFLWDRTRAVRRDFTFHSQKSKEEMKDMVYCFETIARFHAIALHLLSRKGFAAADFDEKQEIDQLGRTILSLMQAYDNCHDYDVPCENEPEFRAYWLLLNAHDPSIMSRIPSWGKETWFESDEIQTALALVQCMIDLKDRWGPIKPRRPHTVSGSAFMNYFAIVEDPSVSYTMACMAEVHFTFVRQRILKNMVKGYARYRDAPRYITAAEVNAMLRFDTDEEAAAFVKAHGFEFSTWVPEGRAPVSEPYVLLNDKKKRLRWPRVQQSFSGKLVERKRTTESLPYVIHNTIYEQSDVDAGWAETPSSPDSLFVSPREGSLAADGADETDAGPDVLAGTLSRESNTAADAFPSLSSATALPPPAALLSLGSTAASIAATNPFSSFAGLKQPAQPFPAANGPASDLSAFQKAAEAPNSFSFLGQTNGQPQSQQVPSTLQETGKPTLSSSSFAAALGKDKDDIEQRPSLFPETAPPEKKVSFGPASSAAQTNSTQPPAFLAGPTSSIPPSQQTSVFSLTPAGTQPTSSATFLPASTTKASSFPPSTTSPSSISASSSAPSFFGTQSATQPSTFSLTGQPSLQPSQPAKTPASQFQFPSAGRTSNIPQGILSPAQAAQPIAPRKTVHFAPEPIAAKKHQQQAQVDGLGNFTKWYVLGDDGLMEQFTEFMVQNLVQEAFDQFQREKEEQKLREEEERSHREAREFQVYNLRVKFFYRWRENARALGLRRILREGKEKMRAYHEQERALQKKQKAAAAQAQREAEIDARRKAQADGYHLRQLARHEMERRQGAEEQLLASGIFSGLRDEREAARRVVNDVAAADGFVVPTARPRRAPDAARASVSSRLSLASRDLSPSVRSDTSKREGWKTRSLREMYGLNGRSSARRSLSPGSSINGGSNFSRSPPDAWARATNFSLKRSADGSTDGDGRGPKRKLASDKPAATTTTPFRSRHWELRARGLIPMPDGHWLPEAIAKPMLEQGKRFAGIGNYGLGPGESGSALLTSDDELDDTDGEPGSSALLREKLRNLSRATPRGSISEAHPPPPPGFGHAPLAVGASLNGGSGSPALSKRKRNAGDGDGDGTSPEDREGSPSAAKRKTSITQQETEAMVADTKRMLRELRDDLDRLDAEERPWMRQQLQKEEREDRGASVGGIWQG